MKIIFKIIFCFCFNFFCAQTINIPDENFKKALLEKHWYNPILDKNNDGEIQFSEASTYTGVISLSYKGIKSLEGIENFVRIKELNCSGNNLKKLDVSKNMLLEKIVADGCNLNEIDLSKNLVLEELSIENNNLLSLNLSSNKSIISLDCSKNLIQSLDLRNNKSLTGINCSENNITSLNIDGLKNIRELNCNENKIDKLNIEYNLDLEQLYCANNVLTELNCNNINLKYLTCNNNMLSILYTGNIKAIIKIDCSYNKLTELHFENNFFLKELECSNNFITELKVENANSLMKLDCSFNRLKSLQVNSCRKLSYLICNFNELEELNVTENKELRELIVNSNRLSRLNLSLNPKLTKIYCFNNNLRELDIANGNNLNITQNRANIFSKYSNNFKAFNNPDLFCIQVDDLNYGVYENFWDKDEQTFFSEDCKTFIKPDTIYRKDRERYISLLVDKIYKCRGVISSQYIKKLKSKSIRKSELERLKNVQNEMCLKEIQIIIDSIGSKNLGDISELFYKSIYLNIPVLYRYLIDYQNIDLKAPLTFSRHSYSKNNHGFWSFIAPKSSYEYTEEISIREVVLSSHFKTVEMIEYFKRIGILNDSNIKDYLKLEYKRKGGYKHSEKLFYKYYNAFYNSKKKPEKKMEVWRKELYDLNSRE